METQKKRKLQDYEEGGDPIMTDANEYSQPPKSIIMTSTHTVVYTNHQKNDDDEDIEADDLCPRCNSPLINCPFTSVNGEPCSSEPVCPDCGNFRICNIHLDAYYCPDHAELNLSTCTRCRKWVCLDDLFECSDCGRLLCTNCGSNNCPCRMSKQLSNIGYFD